VGCLVSEEGFVGGEKCIWKWSLGLAGLGLAGLGRVWVVNGRLIGGV